LGVHVTAQFTFLNERLHGKLLANQLKLAGFANQSSNQGDTLIVVNQRDGQGVIQLIKEGCDLDIM
jgi:aspartyl-tRNA synthetase